MTGETTRRDEDPLPDIEIEIVWQHDGDGIWWAILDSGERVKLVEPWQVYRPWSAPSNYKHWQVMEFRIQYFGEYD
jgi:hypothetical protein